MDLSKSYEFFQPDMLTSRVHMIGCGAIGSTVAENLARFGITKITLYDFDRVEAHNIANQMFWETDLGQLKIEATANQLRAINPDIDRGLKLVPEGWTGQKLSGYVFLCVDNIDLRRQIAEACQGSSAMAPETMVAQVAQKTSWKKKLLQSKLANPSPNMARVGIPINPPAT